MAKASGPDLRKYMEKKLSSACLSPSPSLRARPRRPESGLEARPLRLCSARFVPLQPPLGSPAACRRRLRLSSARRPPTQPTHPRHRSLVPAVKLNANRNVTGNLRGFDQFMNIVLDNTVEEVSETERNDIGLVVRRLAPCAAP